MVFLLFILALPVLFILGCFQVVTVGFEKLGIPSEFTFLLLLAILIGSLINIPLGKKEVVFQEKKSFFGLFKRRKPVVTGLSINVGGAVIPILLSFYFLFLSWRAGADLEWVIAAILIMVVLAKILARVAPGKGVSLPAFLPPLLAALFALILTPDFAASTAFISGTLGVLIGADLLNLKKARSGGGYLSIGGAGVFDGIFLVGIVSALLAGF